VNTSEAGAFYHALSGPKPNRSEPKQRRLRSRASGLVAVAATLALAFGVSACSSSGGKSATANSTLTIGLAQAPTSINPAKGAYSDFPHVLADATIIRAHANGTYSPNLAASWRYVGAGYTDFEFTLRSGLRFSDGTALDAAAAAAWMNYFRKAGGPFATQLGPIKSIAATNARTVHISLGAANPDLPFYLSGPFNWGYLESPKTISNPKTLNTHTVGAGQYVLDAAQTVAGSTFTFLPNKYYYAQSEIKYKKIVVKVITTASSTLAALQTGQIQVAVGEYDTTGAATKAGLKVYSTPANTVGITFLDRNGKISKPLGDLRVRQALNYAVNRPQIAKALIGKYGEPTSEFSSTNGFDPSVQDYYKYDPSRARSLLASAGYPNGFTFTTIVSNDPGTLSLSVAQAMAQQFKAVGVTMRLKTDTGAQYVSDLFSGKFPAQVVDNPLLPQSAQYSTYVAPNAVVNPLKVADPEIDALAKKAAASSSPAVYWKQMSRVYTEHAIWCPALIEDSFLFGSKSVGGIVPIRADQLDPTVWYPT
jgi:peptide/nickel transport system substrate-binding protein